MEQPSSSSTQEVLDSKLSPLHLPKQNFTEGSSRHSINVVRRADEEFPAEKEPSRRYSTIAIKPESSSKLPSQEEHLGPHKEAKVVPLTLPSIVELQDRLLKLNKTGSFITSQTA